MTSFHAQISEIHPKTPAEWRSWLEDNHDTADGVWVIYYRKSTGKRELSWEQAVREALCFGWIDSKSKSIDDDRYKQTFTPRKPKSVWSKVNKDHVAELIEAGQMTDAGLSAIDVARSNGAWSFLEPIDALIVPPDMEVAMGAADGAREAYEALAKSDKRAILYALYSAKREETRAKRVDLAVSDLLNGA